MAIFSGEPLLAALDERDRDTLLRLGADRAYQAGDRILTQGDPDTFVVVIVSGWTVVRGDADNGRSVIFGLCGPMDVIGELAAFDGAPRSATVTALVAVRARLLSDHEFHAYLKDRPRAYAAVARTLVSRLRAADDQSQDLATLPVVRRLARLLLDLDGTGSRVEAAARLTQQELAAAIGASREAVAKALADLRARGVVRTADRRVAVTDRLALQAIAQLQ